MLGLEISPLVAYVIPVEGKYCSENLTRLENEEMVVCS